MGYLYTVTEVVGAFDKSETGGERRIHKASKNFEDF